jgi:transcriptional regulator with XRE-family HTH domain
MSLPRDLDPGASVLAFFGAELRRCRLAADLSQEQLGQQVSYSAALVGLIENAKRVPSRDFAERCDDALATGGALARLWPLVSRETLPGWFRPWIEIEREATSLRSFEPLIIPGLLQTPEYARTLLSAQPAVTEDGLEQLAATRMDRQLILSREDPPQLWCLLDEGALHRRVGGAKAMHDQLLHLAEIAQRPKVTVQVVPFEVGAHAGLLGAFVIASFDGAGDIVYLETAASGQVTETPSVVAEITLTYDTLRSEALPRTASRELIMKVAEQYGPD